MSATLPRHRPILSPIVAALSPANPSILVVAHRGVHDRSPENSLAALERAVALGVDMMEVDAQSNADGTLVALHDGTLDRTTSGTGPVAALTDAVLSTLRLRERDGGAGASMTSERLPGLAAVLEAARGRIFLNVDTKHARDLAAVGRLVLDMGMADQTLVKAEVDPFAARHPAEDLPFFGRLPFMPLFTLEAGRAADQIRAVSRLRPPMVECHFDSLAALAESRAPRAAGGMRLWVNSLDGSHSLDFDDSRASADPEGVWGALLDAGVGAIQTDRAAELIAWLGTRHGSAAR